MKEEGLFKTKWVTGIFAVILAVIGFLFLNSNGLTGNVVLNDKSPIGIASLAGISFIICSAVLAMYSLRK